MNTETKLVNASAILGRTIVTKHGGKYDPRVSYVDIHGKTQEFRGKEWWEFFDLINGNEVTLRRWGIAGEYLEVLTQDRPGWRRMDPSMKDFVDAILHGPAYRPGETPHTLTLCLPDAGAGVEVVDETRE